MKKIFTKNPLVFDKKLATKIGLNESIVLQQIDYWVNINRKKNINFHNNRYWTYNTISAWQKEFPFWSRETVKRVLSSLRIKHLLITDNFNKSRLDRTLWYTINYDELVKYIDEDDININGSSESNNSDALGQDDTTQKNKNTQAIPETSTKISSNISIQSVNQLENKTETKKIDRQKKIDNFNEQYSKIIKKCELYAIDSTYREAVSHAIGLLILESKKNSSVKIGNNYIPSVMVTNKLSKLSFFVIEHAVHKFRQISRKVKINNTIAYLKSCIYNSIGEMAIDIDAELLYNGVI